MKTEQRKWTEKDKWTVKTDNNLKDMAQLVLAFGGTGIIKDPARYTELKSLYPTAHIVLCSTAGEIFGTEVLDDSLVVTALFFEKTTIQVAAIDIAEASQRDVPDGTSQSTQAGTTLGTSLSHEGLVHALVFSDGLKVNGTALVQGITSALPSTVSVTGGLVGDGANFKETYVGLDQPPKMGRIVFIGLYGPQLKVGYGSLGGWDPFGPDRLITKSHDNVLYELDGKPALALYKEYLGEKAKDLPGSGLLFPLSLSIKTDQGNVEVVRTVLAVDEAAQSVTFAGDMPEGVYAKLMKANFERLIDGAGGAAGKSIEALGAAKADMAILISCVGRKLVLGARTEEEIEAVSGILGPQATITGFYSYGEICPTAATEKQCQLHNQTMTITTLREE